MNILVVPATDWLAGPESRLHRIFHRIAQNHSVHCLQLDTGAKVLRQEKLVTLHRPRTIRSTNLAVFHTLNVLSQYQLVKSLIKSEHIDVLVTSNVFGGTAAIQAAETSHVRAVYDYVDYMPFFVEHMTLPSFLKAPLRTILQAMNDYNLRESDLVLAVGRLLCQHARGHNSNVAYIPNGVDTKLFTPQTNGARIRSKFGLASDVIGYVGYIQFWTDFQPVLAGFKRSLKERPSTKLFIVGIGPRLDKLKRQIGDLHLGHSVILPGYVPYAMLPEYLAAMDICILPFALCFATNSVMPLKIHEYAAMAKPVVTTPLYEVTRSYKDAILVAETAEQYEDAFLRLLNDSALRRQMGGNARRIVEQNFNWDTLAAEYEAQLAKLVTTGS